MAEVIKQVCCIPALGWDGFISNQELFSFAHTDLSLLIVWILADLCFIVFATQAPTEYVDVFT